MQILTGSAKEGKIKVRRNCLQWAEHELGGRIIDISKGSSLANPIHIEIHPHHNSTPMCCNNCPACTGAVYREFFSDSGISPSRLIETIDSFKGRTNEVILSGNCIEPLLYPEIIPVLSHIRKAGLELSLYSNFYFATEPIAEEMTRTKNKDYVRASINAGSKNSYNISHKPSDENAFFRILENLENLSYLKMKNNSDLFIHITYLLNSANCNKKELEFITEWAYNRPGINGVRFRAYLKPLAREMPDSAAISQKELERARDFIGILKNQYEREDLEIEITDEGIPASQEKPFNRCYVQEIFAVIGFDGSVYPCTAMASPSNPEYYKFGNINTEDFWDIWKKRGDKRFFPLGRCYDCTRTEHDINCRIQKLSESLASV